MSEILVVGSVAFDTLHNPSGTHRRVLGGSATYASLAASLFTRVKLVGVVGKDWPPAATDMLRSRGVDVEGLEVADGETFHWEGRYSDDLTSRTSLCTDLNVFAHFHPKIPAAHRSTPFVLLGNIHPELQLEVFEQLRGPRLVVADTMNFWITGARDGLGRVLAKTDVLVINEEEARALGETHNIVRVGERLRTLGPKIVIIKRGEYGALLFEGDEIFSAPAFPVADVRDPTGAGDTFAGAFLGYVASRGSTDHATLRRAVIYGSAVASLCVEAIGVEALVHATRPSVDARFERFKRLAHFATDGELA